MQLSASKLYQDVVRNRRLGNWESADDLLLDAGSLEIGQKVEVLVSEYERSIPPTRLKKAYFESFNSGSPGWVRGVVQNVLPNPRGKRLTLLLSDGEYLRVYLRNIIDMRRDP